MGAAAAAAAVWWFPLFYDQNFSRYVTVGPINQSSLTTTLSWCFVYYVFFSLSYIDLRIACFTGFIIAWIMFFYSGFIGLLWTGSKWTDEVHLQTDLCDTHSAWLAQRTSAGIIWLRTFGQREEAREPADTSGATDSIWDGRSEFLRHWKKTVTARGLI